MKNIDILYVLDHYHLGPKCGGPFVSVNNIIDCVKKKYKKIGVLSNEISFPNSNINYFFEFSFTDLNKLFKKFNIKIVHFNTFFSLKLLIFTFFAFFYNYRIIISPRGEIMDGTLKRGFFKKKIFILIFKFFSIFFQKRIKFHYTHKDEQKQSSKNFNKEDYSICQNIPRKIIPKARNINSFDTLKICFFSRVEPKKNLMFTLKVFDKLNIPCVLDVYGDIANIKYYEDCKKFAKQISTDSKIVNFINHVDFETFSSYSSKYHFSCLHTYAENFGHSIIESFYLGIPVLISKNTTPWKNLCNNGLGYDLDLKIDLHVSVLEDYKNKIEILNDEKRFDYLMNFEKNIYDNTLKIYEV